MTNLATESAARGDVQPSGLVSAKTSGALVGSEPYVAVFQNKFQAGTGCNQRKVAKAADTDMSTISGRIFFYLNCGLDFFAEFCHLSLK